MTPSYNDLNDPEPVKMPKGWLRRETIKAVIFVIGAPLIVLMLWVVTPR